MKPKEAVAQAILEELAGIPFLKDAACSAASGGDGFVAMAEFLEQKITKLRTPVTKAAQKVCRGCPSAGACLAWALIEEKPRPGSWGGMYGGLTSTERLEHFGRLSLTERRRLARLAAQGDLTADAVRSS